ncbi:glutamine amidotransferase [Sphingobium sp. CCH11-B1]|jgi:GMP synthase (glutamine-hydrolysing)|uniref:glutamine amidotransferase n=1 Tax=Sphingobium sp. CCH11-B1 TaxID=1768781 RepID=UPI00082D6F7C|nr:glutamine amidotransferase [Sphingobium sp. CCH11-B1]MEA3388963.1 glutamine amidotransferase [Pseudomonadota bacterium]
MKTALIVRHVPREGAAGYLQPIEAAGYRIDRIDVSSPDFAGVDLCDPDLLIMMGGPMGVYEADIHPWIPTQIEKLAARLAADRPTLGVCLGSQMIAAALGAPVYPGGHMELGFAPVSLNAAGRASPLRHIDEVPVLHWHSDTFDLPCNVELLASTGHYPHQAFRRGANLLALQFHAEMGEDPRFEDWLTHFWADLDTARQCIHALRQDHDRHGPSAVAAGRAMIAQWLGGIETKT